MYKTSSKMLSTLGLTAMLLSGAAQAKPFSYTFVEGGMADIEEGSWDGDLVYLGGSFALNRDIFVRASVGEEDYKGVDFDTFNVGVGHPMALSQRTDLVLGLDYRFAESDSRNPALDNLDVDALTASVTSRSWLTNNIEGNLNAGLTHQDADYGDDTGMEVGAGLRLYVIPQFSIAANISRSFVGDLDRDSLGVSARLQF